MIQKHVKRYKIRRAYKKVLAKEKAYPSIKWIYGGRRVCVIGEMCKPNWACKIKLKWCTLRGIHVKYFKTPMDPHKQYRYLFIVDGKYCFDASQPCVGDGTKYIANYLVPRKTETIP